MSFNVEKFPAVMLGAAVLIAVGALAGCRPAAAKPKAAAMQMPTPTVRVEKVGMLSHSEPKSYVATTSPYALIEVVARVSGTMTKGKFKEGGLVAEGELLYNIEDTVYAANVRSAKATVAQVEAELAFAQSEYDRYKTLIASKATSRTNYESSLRTLKSCEARLEAAKAALTLAENDLSYTKIYSPINGRIGQSIYSSSNYITPAKGALATIVQYDPIKLRFAMSEADFMRHFGKGKSQPELQIFCADGSEYKQTATLDFADNRVDTATGTIMLQFLVPNPDQVLTPDGFATVKFSEKFEKPLPAVSISALMTDGKQHFVYVVGADNLVEKRTVQTGAQVGEQQLILSGLKEGELVVTGGSHKAVPGKPVKPIGFAEVERK